jgi:hypothetical protein
LACCFDTLRTTRYSEEPDEDGFQPLFSEEGAPQGWVVRDWADVSQPAPENAQWLVRDGVLHGSDPRGTWLISEQEYGDFELKFEFQLGPRGNSGVALRSPLQGDPAFDGLELQMVDLRYRPDAKDSELTGGLYRALAPLKQVYRPTEWNGYHITLRGSHIRVLLNDELILDHDLSQQDMKALRHDGTEAPPLKDRPKRGHSGFQELSRDGSQVLIRHARIRVLE